MLLHPWKDDSYLADQEIPCFYGIWRLITIFKTAHLWTLFWAS